MAKLIKKGKYYICEKCGEILDSWIEDISGVSFTLSFDEKGSLIELDKAVYGDLVQISCGNCGEILDVNPNDIYEMVKSNCKLKGQSNK